MPVFVAEAGKLRALSSQLFRYEKDLQKLVEDNLMAALEMHFIASEYPTAGGRIDTLAVDVNGAPVIIEYKRDRNGSAINQALFYLQWLTAQKEEFFRMLMIMKLGKSVADSIRLDWKNPRVICIAESFSRFDMATAEMVKVRMELFRYRQYESRIFTLDPVTTADTYHPSQEFTPVGHDANQAACDVLKAQSNASVAIQGLFDDLRERILCIDDRIIEKTNRKGAIYAISKHFAEMQIKKNQLVIDLRPIDYADPKGKVERIGVGYKITMNRRIVLAEAGDLDYVFEIIRQSYQDVL